MIVIATFVVAGLLIGSFLNVVIARLPEGRSLVRPGSACPGCGPAIVWYHNVPVVSFVALRGRCRAGAMTIPLRYPGVEAVTGATFGSRGCWGVSSGGRGCYLASMFLLSVAVFSPQPWWAAGSAGGRARSRLVLSLQQVAGSDSSGAKGGCGGTCADSADRSEPW